MEAAAGLATADGQRASPNRQQDWSAQYAEQWRPESYDTGQEGLYWLWDTADGGYTWS